MEATEKHTNTHDWTHPNFGLYFEPDILTPSQFYGGIAEKGERGLLCALLDEALTCIKGKAIGAGRYSRLTIAQRTKDWIESNSDESYSFIFCCQHLNIDAERIRKMFLESYLTEYAWLV